VPSLAPGLLYLLSNMSLYVQAKESGVIPWSLLNSLKLICRQFTHEKKITQFTRLQSWWETQLLFLLFFFFFLCSLDQSKIAFRCRLLANIWINTRSHILYFSVSVNDSHDILFYLVSKIYNTKIIKNTFYEVHVKYIFNWNSAWRNHSISMQFQWSGTVAFSSLKEYPNAPWKKLKINKLINQVLLSLLKQ